MASRSFLSVSGLTVSLRLPAGDLPHLGESASSKPTGPSKRAPGDMNRVAAVIADWDAAIGTESAPRGAQLVASHATVPKLNEPVIKLREGLKRKDQAALTVIAELSVHLQSASGHEPTGDRHTLEEGPATAQTLAILTLGELNIGAT
jgi:hypothetical protein